MICVAAEAAAVARSMLTERGTLSMGLAENVEATSRRRPEIRLPNDLSMLRGLQ